ncbi:unnamed protein product [Didymodactylos carnosus]|uniref:Reverse transcriptase domain-containing protein n=1 Tax=Didymodactylos carnosus TaxID=1234261 RepID=A0A8S2F5A8_9BILA|nr:unnamed protein product [Didymodactylos carnosus]CAF4139886.1 unnamed protein product [Didymodactylos carnosus]
MNETKFVAKLIAGVETGIYRKSLGDREEIVSEVKRVLEQQLQAGKKKYFENLSRTQKKAIKKLKEDEEIIVIPADKGGRVVVMNVTDYIKKIREKLDTKAYELLEEDPSKSIHKKLELLLAELVGRNEIDQDEMEMLLENKKIPFVRGQLKVHKPDKSMRLIVSMRDTMGSALTKFITNITKSVADNNRSIKNTQDLVIKLYKLKVKKTSKLVSLDITDLFTSVDREKVIVIVNDLLDQDESWKSKSSLTKESLLRLIEFSIENVIFQFGSQFYKQVYGLPMGSSISPFLADTAVNNFLLKHWNFEEYPYIGLARYVDDILLISELDKTQIQQLVKELNSKNDLQFTFEYEKDHKIPFLDVLI